MFQSKRNRTASVEETQNQTKELPKWFSFSLLCACNQISFGVRCSAPYLPVWLTFSIYLASFLTLSFHYAHSSFLFLIPLPSFIVFSFLCVTNFVRSLKKSLWKRKIKSKIITITCSKIRLHYIVCVPICLKCANQQSLHYEFTKQIKSLSQIQVALVYIVLWLEVINNFIKSFYDRLLCISGGRCKNHFYDSHCG